MPASEPGWWYGTGRSSSAKTRLLAPLGTLYGRIAERRYRAREPYRPALPVICVGNFTAGGTGKTPLALAIAEMLKALGEAPVFLTRGYGGAARGPMWLDAARDTAAIAGDEPMLLARTAPVMIARDRRAGVRMIETQHVPATVIVMDDGLQNPGLAKQLSIAVVDGRRGLGNGKVIPAGPLRAPLAFQLGLADAIVVNGRSSAGTDAPLLARLRQEFPGPVLEARPAPAGETDWLQTKPILAFAGIASPDRFFSLLEHAGASLVARRVFADHHDFTPVEAEALMAAARSREALLVTTEKDWVRLSGRGGALDQLAKVARTLPIKLAFAEREEARLAGLVEGALARARAQS